MNNYKLLISYDGTNYCGWQNQPNMKTIQGEIENALRKIFNGQEISLIGSGRTDSGVHALNQTANFHIKTNMLDSQIKDALNANLDNSIFVNSCVTVSDKFHSRFSALKRGYVYNATTEYSPFSKNYEWKIKYNLNLDRLNYCSQLLIGEHDFSKFCKSTSRKENNNCNIFESKWNIKNEKIVYNIISNRFLHHMVRLLVGTMIEVGVDRMNVSEFKCLIDNEPSSLNPVKAPAKGLFLKNVFY